MLKTDEIELELECSCGCSLLHLSSVKLGKQHNDTYCDIDIYNLYSEKGRKLKSPKIAGGVVLKYKELNKLIKFLQKARDKK